MAKYGNGNNADVGAIKPKTGFGYTPLCRQSGYNKTMEACQSKTRSRYKGTEKHYRYEGISSDEGGNVHGYNPE